MSLFLFRLMIALCSYPLSVFFFRGVTELKTELTPSLSCCVVSSSRWEAMASVDAIYA